MAAATGGSGGMARLLGRSAEQRAERLLRRAGLRLIDRNWRCPGGELDLIMSDGDTLVFVEVRRRSSASHGSAAESVGPRKRRRIIRSAERYLQSLGEARPCRFDLVTFDGPEGRDTLRWIRAAFDATDMP